MTSFLLSSSSLCLAVILSVTPAALSKNMKYPEITANCHSEAEHRDETECEGIMCSELVKIQIGI